MYVILLGAPGAGKGTQGERLEKHLHMPHFSSGALFRDAMWKRTELGLIAQTYMDKGLLVPDDVTIAMLDERLGQPEAASGVILDGFPRTVAQADALNQILSRTGRDLNRVFYIEVAEQNILLRIRGRYICNTCQATYHIVYKPPSVEGICDVCGGVLRKRDDDKPEVIKDKVKVYYEQTKPLIEYYSRCDKLTRINGNQDIEAVYQDILKALNTRRPGLEQVV